MVSVPWSPCRAWIHGWVHDSRRFRARGTKEDRGRIAVAGGRKGMKKRDKGAKKSAYPSPRPEADCWAHDDEISHIHPPRPRQASQILGILSIWAFWAISTVSRSFHRYNPVLPWAELNGTEIAIWGRLRASSSAIKRNQMHKIRCDGTLLGNVAGHRSHRHRLCTCQIAGRSLYLCLVEVRGPMRCTTGDTSVSAHGLLNGRYALCRNRKCKVLRAVDFCFD